MKRISQKTQVLNHLKKSQLSSILAVHLYGITRLAEYIRQLRKDGHSIDSNIQYRKNNKSFALYNLNS